MNRSSTPRSLIELKNVMLCVREAATILDEDRNFSADPRFQAVSEDLFNAYCQLRGLLDEKHTETGWGYEASATIAITNKVEA